MYEICPTKCTKGTPMLPGTPHAVASGPNIRARESGSAEYLVHLVRPISYIWSGCFVHLVGTDLCDVTPHPSRHLVSTLPRRPAPCSC